MWRFINNLSRVFRTHIYNPRPSAGVLVEDEQDVERREHGRRHSYSFNDAKDKLCKEKGSVNSDTGCHYAEQSENDARTDNDWNRWSFGEDTKQQRKTFFNSYWQLHVPQKAFEVFTWGPAVLLGTDRDYYKRKSRLLYRVLFALPNNNNGITTKSSIHTDQKLVFDPRPSSELLAIKDAEGSAIDQEINIAKTETLESAIAEFEQVSREYTAKSASLQGLEAIKCGDMESAVGFLCQSCMLGNVSACFNLGLCYETGSGVTRDYAKAVYYYKKAAEGGHCMALYNLGLMCLRQREEAHKDQAMDDLGLSSEMGLNFITEAARLGLAEAQTFLGCLHMDEEHQNLSTAVSYFKEASDQNDHEAQYFLGVCYEQGLGVELNECLAAKFYSLAAKGGHELALYNLAVFNQHGLGGLPKDEAAAKDMYARAAKHGIWQAEECLAQMEAVQYNSMTASAFQNAKETPNADSEIGGYIVNSEEQISEEENDTPTSTPRFYLSPSNSTPCFHTYARSTVHSSFHQLSDTTLNKCDSGEEAVHGDSLLGRLDLSEGSIEHERSELKIAESCSSSIKKAAICKSNTFSEFSMIGI